MCGDCLIHILDKYQLSRIIIEVTPCTPTLNGRADKLTDEETNLSLGTQMKTFCFENLLEPDESALRSQVRDLLSRIDGWLAEPAVIYTAYLMQLQNKQQVKGGVLELGVYRGRYLALLYLCSAAAPRPVLGIDIFAGVDNEKQNRKIIDMVRNNVANVAKPFIGQIDEGAADVDQANRMGERLRFIVADTLTLDGSLLHEHLGGAAAFISVDGGHEAEHLVNDLGLSAEWLADGGIVAVDDAFNHSTPGAIEGTCRFFEQRNRGRLVPFAHCYNKLFLCRPADYANLIDKTKRFVTKHQAMDFCRRTLHRMKENERVDYIPRFFGWELVPFL